MIRLAGLANSIRRINEAPVSAPAPEYTDDGRPVTQAPNRPAVDQLDVKYFASEVDSLLETIDDFDRELIGRLETLSSEYDEYRGNVYSLLNGSASRYLEAVKTNLEGLQEALTKIKQ